MPKSLMSHRAPALSGLQISHYFFGLDLLLFCSLPAMTGHTGQLNPPFTLQFFKRCGRTLLGAFAQDCFLPNINSLSLAVFMYLLISSNLCSNVSKSSEALPKLPYTQPLLERPLSCFTLLCYNIPSAIGKKYYFDSFSHLSSK